MKIPLLASIFYFYELLSSRVLSSFLQIAVVGAIVVSLKYIYKETGVFGLFARGGFGNRESSELQGTQHSVWILRTFHPYNPVTATAADHISARSQCCVPMLLVLSMIGPQVFQVYQILTPEMKHLWIPDGDRLSLVITNTTFLLPQKMIETFQPWMRNYKSRDQIHSTNLRGEWKTLTRSYGILLMLRANSAVLLGYCPPLLNYGSASQNYCFYSARTQLLCFLERFRGSLEKHWLILT